MNPPRRPGKTQKGGDKRASAPRPRVAPREETEAAPTPGEGEVPALAKALAALIERLPAGFERAPLEAARGKVAAGEPPDLRALLPALAAAESALEAVVRADALPVAPSPSALALDPALLAVHTALAAMRVVSSPAPGAAIVASPAGVDLADDDAPPGTVLRVLRRGFQGEGAMLLAPSLLVSRGRLTLLEQLLAELASDDVAPEARQRDAAPEARPSSLRPLALELLARASSARDAQARGEVKEPVRIVALRTAAAALLRAWPDAGADADMDALAPRLLTALSAVDPEVGPFPTQEDGHAPRISPTTLREAERYQWIGVWSDVVPPGRAVRLLRPGLRELRPGGAALVPARVEQSLGPRPALDRALDDLRAAWPGGEPEPEEALADLRETLREVALAGPEQEGAARIALGRSATALLDLVEARADQTDAAAAGLRALLDGALADALRASGITPLSVDDALKSALLRKRWAWSELPQGEVLGWARRGLRVDDAVLRPGEVRVSAGPRGPLGPIADALLARLEQVSEPARTAVADRVGLERAIEADRLHGRASHGVRPVRERALALLDALEAALASAPALEQVRSGALLEALRGFGWSAFPAPGTHLAPADRADATRFARVDGRPDPAPRGVVVSIGKLGLTENGSPVRPAHVTISLGPVAQALLSGALPEPPPTPLMALRDALLDPLRDVADDEPARAAFAARRGAEKARSPAFESLLRALEAEVFPAPGEPAPGPEAAERKLVVDDAPAGTLLRVLRQGLRWRGKVLERAEVEVSKGPLTASQKGLMAAAAALPEHDRAGPLGREIELLADELETLAPDAAGTRLASLLDAFELPGRSDALVALEHALAARGLRVLPAGAGGTWDGLQAGLPAGAFLPPRRTCGPEPAGVITAIERRALIAADRVLRPGRVRVAVGRHSPLHGVVLSVRPALEPLAPEVRGPALDELDELLDRIAAGTPEREHLLALPAMSLLHRLELKEKVGGPLKEYLREQGIKEVIAYPNYEANKLGPTRLEEVRVNSDRPVGRIVKVLRPGFERADGTVLQKVRAEVSR